MFSENVLTCLENPVRRTSPSRSKSFNSIFCNIAIANILHSCCDLLQFSVKGQDRAVYVGVTSGGIARLEFSLMLEVGQQEFLSEAPIWLTQVGSTKAHGDRWKTNRVLDISKTDIHADGHDVMYVPMKKRCVWYVKSSHHNIQCWWRVLGQWHRCLHCLTMTKRPFPTTATISHHCHSTCAIEDDRNTHTSFRGIGRKYNPTNKAIKLSSAFLSELHVIFPAKDTKLPNHVVWYVAQCCLSLLSSTPPSCSFLLQFPGGKYRPTSRSTGANGCRGHVRGPWKRTPRQPGKHLGGDLAAPSFLGEGEGEDTWREVPLWGFSWSWYLHIQIIGTTSSVMLAWLDWTKSYVGEGERVRVCVQDLNSWRQMVIWYENRLTSRATIYSDCFSTSFVIQTGINLTSQLFPSSKSTMWG